MIFTFALIFKQIVNINHWLEMVIAMMKPIICIVTLMVETVATHASAKHFAQIVNVSLKLQEKN